MRGYDVEGAEVSSGDMMQDATSSDACVCLGSSDARLASVTKVQDLMLCCTYREFTEHIVLHLICVTSKGIYDS